MQNSTSKVRVLTGTAMLGAVAAVLMYLEFPIPIMPAFVKLDVSELPALIASFAYGPVSGILVCLIKNLIKLPSTSTAAVGELFNFVMGALFVGVAGLIYKRNKTRKGAIVGALLGALVIVVFLRGARQTGDRAFRWMWLAIVLSFAFYIPVVLWADVVPLVGMLMIPKTCAYVWVVWMGFSDMHRKRKETVK